MFMFLISFFALLSPTYAGEVTALTMSFANTTRHALVYVPTLEDPTKPVPVVINFHALASDPLAQVRPLVRGRVQCRPTYIYIATPTYM